MVTPSEDVRKKAVSPSVTTGLVFELEKMTVPGQRILFEVCQKILKDKQVALTPVMWSRYVLSVPFAQGLGRVLAKEDKKSQMTDKLLQEIRDAFFHELTRPAVKLNKVFDDLLAEATELNFKIGALSFLPGEQAQALLSLLGLQDRVRLNVMQKPNAMAPTPDCWLMTCKAVGVLARRSVALIDGAVACNAALEAGLRCCAVPNEFTAYQDFGGADQVVDDLKDVHIKELQSFLHSCAFR